MLQKLPLGIAAALLLALVAFNVTPATEVTAQDAADITIQAGGGEPGYSVNAFLPGEVTIMEGQSIAWEFPWYEPHIVAFIETEPAVELEISPPGTEFPNEAGYVYSGDIFGDPEDPPVFGPIVFPEAGEYEYFCPIHPLMTAVVNVVASGDVDTQEEVDARGAAEYATRLATVKALGAALAAEQVTVTPRPDGTSLYEVVVGGVTPEGDDVMQFFPATANLLVGDTVKWTTNNATPHTVTFNAPPGPPQGDPFAIPRTAETTFAGEGFRHSGILWTVPEENSFTEYELTFTGTGSFQYICILHAPQGMAGTVNVAAAPPPSTPTPVPPTPTPTQTTAPAPPATGSGVTSNDGTSPIWFLAIAGLLVMVAGGGVVVSARR